VFQRGGPNSSDRKDPKGQPGVGLGGKGKREKEERKLKKRGLKKELEGS